MSLTIQAARKLLAREIRRQATKGRRVFATDVSRLDEALQRLERVNDQITRAKGYKSKTRDWVESQIVHVQNIEADVARQMKRVGLERKRSAQMLARIREAVGFTTEEEKLLRRSLRSPGGSFEVLSQPGMAQKGGAGFRGAPGGRGTVSMTPTRHELSDLTVMGHELGHGMEHLGRQRPELQSFLERLRSISSENVLPYRQPGSPIRRSIAMHQAQQAQGRTMAPATLERAVNQAMAKEGRFSPGLRELLTDPMKPHSPEEPFADMFAMLVNPELRSQLPYAQRVMLSRMLPRAFPEAARRRALRARQP